MQTLIVAARAPLDIRRDRALRPASSSNDFVRAWWAGVRRFQPGAGMGAMYEAGYAAGLAWREFHGRSRQPHEGHANDALVVYRESSEDLRGVA
jgi:hypothetical protein